jgi:deazaflavin-dependent oxidoreductase (nitroreductase family)
VASLIRSRPSITFRHPVDERNATERDQEITMTTAMNRAPALIRRSGGLTNRLLNAGLPLGPNVQLTIRGRTSGKPRTTPLAVIETNQRRFVIGAYGDVQWTKNLRAAGEAEIRHGGASERVAARELPAEEAEAWFATMLGPYVRRSIGLRLFSSVFFRLVAPDVLTDPGSAARHRPVFELTPETR